jgi:hypothetical protein
MSEQAISDPELVADLRQCVLDARRLWAAVHEEAKADREAHQALARGLREAFTNEPPCTQQQEGR